MLVIIGVSIIFALECDYVHVSTTLRILSNTWLLLDKLSPKPQGIA